MQRRSEEVTGSDMCLHPPTVCWGAWWGVGNQSEVTSGGRPTLGVHDSFFFFVPELIDNQAREKLMSGSKYIEIISNVNIQTYVMIIVLPLIGF